ncbi:MAG: DUF551 domain-containing protein [Pseudobutyrivibrio sp.]|nr:DUF551 domain-containing protein [Pseudobutyrivibrio sp.]
MAELKQKLRDNGVFVGRWIPVSERLPKDNKEVLVYLDDKPFIAWFENGEWLTDDFIVDKEFEPIAWIPLPEPYKAESKDI